MQRQSNLLPQENILQENYMRNLRHVSKGSFPSIDYGVELVYLFPMNVDMRHTLESGRSNIGNEKLPLSIKEQQELEFKRIVSKARKDGVHLTFANKNARTSDDWLLSMKKNEYCLASPLSPSFESIEKLLFVLAAKGDVVQPDKTYMRIEVDAQNRTLQEARNVYKNILAVEQLLNYLQPEVATLRGRESGEFLRDRFANLLEAYRAIDAADTFQSLVKIGSESSLYERQWPYQINFGITLTSGNNQGVPHTFNFHGLESSTDPSVIIAWIQLATKLVQRSCEGYILEPTERTLDDAWTALFSELIQDDALEMYFLEYRKLRRGYRLKLELINQLYKVWDPKFWPSIPYFSKFLFVNFPAFHH